MKTITYDDTLWQLVPKEPITKLLVRYEEMRQRCMRIGNRHPDSTLCCHKSLGSYGTATEHGMALLLDDMILVLSAAPTPPAQPADDWEKKLRAEIDHAIVNDLRLSPAFGRLTGDPAVRISDIEAVIDCMAHAQQSAQPAERKPLTEEQVQKLMDTHLTHNHSLSADFDMPVYACTIENVLDLLQAAHGIKGES